MLNLNMEMNYTPDLFTLYPTVPSFDMQMHDQIQSLLGQYWFWVSDFKSYFSGSFDNSTQDGELVNKLQTRPIKSRKGNKLLKSRNTQDGLVRLQEVLSHYSNNGQILIKRAPKSKTKARAFKSTRRSSYIGVSKNGDVWQALIMIDSKKTYIGSYHTEEEAAMAYDFFSIVMKQIEAKTNFDYTLDQIRTMTQNYFENGYEFIPSFCL